ncbi:Uncharacterized protein Rs2_18629 [Raphanus sativus]|nr:Uncharacterized protein Rs2_18629 [Raphanus sativus]
MRAGIAGRRLDLLAFTYSTHPHDDHLLQPPSPIYLHELSRCSLCHHHSLSGLGSIREKLPLLSNPSLDLLAMSSLISSCSLFLLGIDLEAEKTRKKTELELSSDGEKSRNKTKVDLNQSAAAAITDVDESYELRGNVQLEVVATESSPRDDTLPETARKETEMGNSFYS